MTYIGVSPSNGVRRVHTYTATGSQTTFTGASSEGITLSYTDANFMDVYQNGVLLAPADYTATSGTSVVLAEGAAASDIVTITVYDAFSVADTVSKSAGGTFDGAVTFAANIDASSSAVAMGTFTVEGPISLIKTNTQLQFGDTGTYIHQSADGVLDLVSDNEIEINGTTIDINGAVDMSSTLTIAGNVGIGETSPLGKLHIRSSDASITSVNANSDELVLENNGTCGISIASATNATGNVTFIDSGDTNQGRIQYDHSDNHMNFRVNDAERMRITSAGNVGIGTSSPANNLHVMGSMTLQGSSGTDNAWTFYKNTDQTYLVGLRGSSNDALAFYDLTADVERMRIDTSGRVGINQTSFATVDTMLSISELTGHLEVGLISKNDSGCVLNFGDPEDYNIGRLKYDHSDNSMRFDTNNSERMRIDSSGKVGIGTTNPLTKLHIREADTTTALTIGNTTENTALEIRTHQDDKAVLRATDGTTARSMAFETGTSEKMRIDSGGSIGINTPVIAGYRLAILTNGSAEYQAIFKSSNTSGTQYHLGINRDTTQAGHLTSNANNQVALNNGSDYRLKENISDMTDGIERVKQLQPKKFNFLSNPDKEIVDGFLAHEVKDLVPYSVLGEKDAVDKDGEPVMQTIDITALIPVLTGAIKELIAKVETLEAEVKSLKGE